MGYYFYERIADVTREPARVSLSGNANYIQFESKKGAENKPVEVNIEVLGVGIYLDDSNPNNPKFVNATKFTIRETKTGIEYTLSGTSNISEINKDTFYIGPRSNWPIEGWPVWQDYQAAESLRDALRQNDFIGNNFDIMLSPKVNPDGSLSRGTNIKLRSRGFGDDYSFKIVADTPELWEHFLSITGDTEDTTNNDSIASGYNPVEIQLDVYRDTGVFLGEDDLPNDTNLGTYVKTLTKAYSYSPIWFNTNILSVDRIVTDFLFSDKWVNTGTVRDYRLTARRFINDIDKYENTIFYYSNVLYMIAGYKRALETNELSDYIYNTNEGNIVRPLTNQPTLTHTKGQTQYFNFILSDPDRHKNLGANEYSMGLIYRLYTQSGKFISDIILHEQTRKLFSMVNSIKLDIDGVIGDRADVGIVDIYLSRDYPDISQSAIISEPIRFNILPECLYKVNDFAFLNPLGGWSSFNFSGTKTTDFKASANIIYKTQTPEHNISSEIESVYTKDTEEQFTVQTMPIDKAVCDWLKELSSSIAVYEISTKRYVVVDEMNIKPNSKDDLFRIEMKYHYSDKYNS